MIVDSHVTPSCLIMKPRQHGSLQRTLTILCPISDISMNILDRIIAEVANAKFNLRWYFDGHQYIALKVYTRQSIYL